MKEDISEKVIDIISQETGITPESISLNADFVTDLGIDSLDTASIISTVNAEFLMNINPSEAVKIATVGALVDYIAHQSTKLNSKT